MASSRVENFSHLTAEERLFVGAQRIHRTGALVTEVVRLNEQTRAFFRSDFYGMAQMEAQGADTLLQTILHYEVVQLCRLWDKFDAYGFGLPTMALLLKDSEVFPLIRLNLEQHHKPVIWPSGGGILGDSHLPESVLSSPPDFDSRIDELEDALKRVFKVSDSAEMKRVRNYRDKRIAHPLLRTQAEIGKTIPDARSADLDGIVNETVAIMTTLESVLLATYSDYEETRQAARSEAEEFMSRVEYRPKSVLGGTTGGSPK